MSFNSLLTKTCDVRTVTETNDDYGTTTESTTTILDNIPCAIRPLSGRETLEWEKETVRSTHKIYTKYYSVITEAKRVVCDSNTYDIHFVANPAGKNHHLELVVELIK